MDVKSENEGLILAPSAHRTTPDSVTNPSASTGPRIEHPGNRYNKRSTVLGNCGVKAESKAA